MFFNYIYYNLFKTSTRYIKIGTKSIIIIIIRKVS